MKVIILAVGRATRLPESAKDIPKSLVKVGEKAILDHQFEILRTHGFSDIRLALGFRAEDIIRHAGDWAEYVVEPRKLGTGGAIKFASRDLDQPFMVLNGDVLFDADLSLMREQYERLSKGSHMILAYEAANAADYGLLKLEGENVIRFFEKPNEPRTGFINAGAYVLFPGIFSNTRKEEFSMEEEIFPPLASEGNLYYHLHKGLWIDLGTEERLREAREQFRR